MCCLKKKYSVRENNKFPETAISEKLLKYNDNNKNNNNNKKNEESKYLVILKADNFKQGEMKEKIKKEYLSRWEKRLDA